MNDGMNILMDRIKKNEGLVLTAYKCPAGRITIGYGRNLEDNGISEEEADMLLKNDVNRIDTFLSTNDYWRVLYKSLCPPRQGVLIEMAFQLGIEGLSSFKSFIRAITTQEWIVAAQEMINSKWCAQTPRRAQELADIMRYGEW